MSFTIVAETSGLQIINSKETARDALMLAIARRKDGAQRVFVYDAQARFVSATALAHAVRLEIGAVGQKAIEDALADLTWFEKASPQGDQQAPEHLPRADAWVFQDMR
jgi:hypothetical protein